MTLNLGNRAPAHAALTLLLTASLLVAACAGPGSLSGSRAGTATKAPVPAAPPAPTPAPPAPTPAPPPAPATTYPLPAAGATPQAAPAAPLPAARPTTDAICVVLPLESSSYGRAAAAVKAGFLAAADAAGSRARVRVIGHGDDGVLPAFAAAAESGAALIVGPLTRDDVKTVLAMALTRPRVLVLNQPEDGSVLPDDVYALTLSIDSDAALVAGRLRDDGARTVATVASDAPLQRRFKAAFAAAWGRAGGAPAHDYRFDPNPEVLRVLRRELAARPTDATLLAVGSGDAALAKSFLPPGAVYASSQIADDLPGPMLRDLEGVRYVEIPWLADPSSPALARFPRADLGDPVLERLYALGLDAFAIAELLASPIPPDRVELDGATGHLALGPPTRVFSREGRLMVIRDGQPTVYSAPQ
jgi:outer membrane PBP1 activator LpoA protein